MPEGTVWSQPPPCPYVLCALLQLPAPSNTLLLSLGLFTGPTKQTPFSLSLTAAFRSNPSLLLHTPFSDRSCTTSHRPHLYRSALAQPPLSSSTFSSSFPRFSRSEGRCSPRLRAFSLRRGRRPSSPPWQDAGSAGSTAGPCCPEGSRPSGGNACGCCLGYYVYHTLCELSSGEQRNVSL